MTHSKTTIAGLIALAFLSAIPVATAQRESRERGIVVSVSRGGDTPVTDMAAADFTIRENGVAREVLRVAPAPPPSHIALLIDDSQALNPNVPFLRSAMSAFLLKMGALTPAPLQALYTFGERPTRRADYSPNPDGLIDASKRLFAINGSGAYFLQAVNETARDLRKREAPSPVIVAFVAESGPEFSSDLHTQVADALKAAGASLWAITLQIGPQQSNRTEARERAALLGDVTMDSGGMNKVVLSGQGIESAFDAVATLIASRYLVTYGRPDALVPPDKIEVTSRRRDVRIGASRWAGR